MSHIETGATLRSPEGPTTLKFENDYVLSKKLSKGSFGTVYSAKHKPSGYVVAVKVIEKKNLAPKDVDAVTREVSILKDCKNVENVIQLLDFYSSPLRYHVVQVMAYGGDVFERLANRTSYNEQDARQLAIRLLDAIKALHARKICHRDLKPENLLLKDQVSDSQILLADFGFASHVPEGGLKTRCGTPAFVAPEVLVQDCRYNENVDMWSVGCLLFMLLGGYPPFQDRNHRGLFRKIRGADYCFHDTYWKNVSVPCKQLISSCLTTDPQYRCTAKMALQQAKWLKIDSAVLERNDLSESLSEIKRFQARQSLKGAMHAVLWSVRPKLKTADHILDRNLNDWDRAYDRPKGSKFEDIYELKSQIHSSSAATIYECVHRESGNTFAVKIFDRNDPKRKTILGRSLTETVLHEVAVLKSVKHRHIIEVIDFFEEPDYFYLVMERMAGGDVFDRIIQRRQYTEKDARDLLYILLQAVDHLHSKGVAHRDIKPQNLLLKSKENDSIIKIADFGFACRVHTPQSLVTRCGTPTYVAPEVLKNIPYDQSVDMWSVGVILYVLLCGYPPFANDDQSMLFQQIRTASWEFHEQDWKHVSPEAKELIQNLLIVDPSRRYTARQALQSDWLRQDNANLSMVDLSAGLEAMKERKQKLRNVARSVLWMTKGLTSARDTLAGKDEDDNGKLDKMDEGDEEELNDDNQTQKIIM